MNALAERAPVPVQVAVPEERLPPAVESAAYFVVAEALVNVAKYAKASQAWVSVASDNGSALVEGARGLADRVGALGGELRIESRPGYGTRIIADMPCG